MAPSSVSREGSWRLRPNLLASYCKILPLGHSSAPFLSQETGGDPSSSQGVGQGVSRCRVHLPQHAVLLSWGRLWAGSLDPHTTLDLKLLALGSVGLSIQSSSLTVPPAVGASSSASLYL